MKDKDTRSSAFEAGMAVRKQVLGAAYVDKSFADADDFNRPFQEILTEFAWGKVWTRPGLALKTRSMLTLAMCVALNRPHEIKLHLRGAVRNGCTDEEIRELLIHSFIYCGGPAAVDGFNHVRSLLPGIRAEEAAAAKEAKPAKASTAPKAARKDGKAAKAKGRK
jgi:4-carboxymuconolactone decarboxylase